MSCAAGAYCTYRCGGRRFEYTRVIHMTRLHAKRPLLVELRVINGPIEGGCRLQSGAGAWLACNTSMRGRDQKSKIVKKEDVLEFFFLECMALLDLAHICVSDSLVRTAHPARPAALHARLCTCQRRSQFSSRAACKLRAATHCLAPAGCGHQHPYAWHSCRHRRTCLG